MERQIIQIVEEKLDNCRNNKELLYLYDYINKVAFNGYFYKLKLKYKDKFISLKNEIRQEYLNSLTYGY